MSRTETGRDSDTRAGRRETPWLEWLSAGIGLVLAVTLFGFVGWQAMQSPGEPPVLVVEVESILPVTGGYRVDFVTRNHTAGAAAQVEVEGTLRPDQGGEEETGRAAFDYIPGQSERRGGLFFRSDPRAGRLTLRATGYAQP